MNKIKFSKYIKKELHKKILSGFIYTIMTDPEYINFMQDDSYCFVYFNVKSLNRMYVYIKERKLIDVGHEYGFTN